MKWKKNKFKKSKKDLTEINNVNPSPAFKETVAFYDAQDANFSKLIIFIDDTIKELIKYRKSLL
jgi:hypothetical protein